MTKTVVITGASRGIGLGLARHYAESEGWQVFATCRQPDQAESLNKLVAQHENVAVLKLDVTDTESVQRFVADLNGQAVDLLINNAGMYGSNAPLLPVDIAQWHDVFHLNCIAPVYLAQQLFDNLAASHDKKLVTISSDMGSIAANQGGGAYLYRSSKAALNAAMRSFAIDTKEHGFTVLMLHPGHVMTDMGGKNAKVTVADSVAGLTKVIASATPEQSGAFFNWRGESMPW